MNPALKSRLLYWSPVKDARTPPAQFSLKRERPGRWAVPFGGSVGLVCGVGAYLGHPSCPPRTPPVSLVSPLVSADPLWWLLSLFLS